MTQHPIFKKYTRAWLHEVTGYSKNHLARINTGKMPLSRTFVERVCYSLQEHESELFLTSCNGFPVTHAGEQAEISKGE